MNLDIKITHVEQSQLKTVPQDYSKLAFGQNFTDHMLIMRYSEPNGWSHAEIIPYGDISISPAASVLHYAQEIFEGMKAYKTSSGKIQLFRPRLNFERLNTSAERMCMPQVDIDYVLSALKELLKIEERWIPSQKGTALYIRPTMIASEPFLGVHAAKEYLFFIILSPVGSYFKDGFKPVKIMVEDKYIRAAPGGVGFSKTGGNYAASLKAAQEAAKRGYSQVLWLDAIERKYIGEVGAMNIAFCINDEIITPELDGTILPGITRRSVIEFCKKRGIPITERRISVEEIIDAVKNGTLKEAFGMGTAAVIAPVGAIFYKGTEYLINNFEVGKISRLLFDEITGIQIGEKEDSFGWIEPVNQ
ncbi:branched-chain amino acid aminotransferase [Candidatus Harpocratesius sp.]